MNIGQVRASRRDEQAGQDWEMAKAMVRKKTYRVSLTVAASWSLRDFDNAEAFAAHIPSVNDVFNSAGLDLNDVAVEEVGAMSCSVDDNDGLTRCVGCESEEVKWSRPLATWLCDVCHAGLLRP
jgi:hypothetical protein